MRIDDAANAVETLLGEFSSEVLAETQLGARWVDVLRLVPSDTWIASLGSRLPGLGVLLNIRGHWAAHDAWRPAAAVTRGLVQLLDARLGPEHPDTLAEVAMLGDLAAKSGRSEAARTLLRRAWRGLQDAPAGRRLGIAGRYLALLKSHGAHAESLEVASWCWSVAGQSRAAAKVGAWLADVHLSLGAPVAALDALMDAWRVGRQQGSDQRELARVAGLMIELARAQGRLEDVLEPARSMADWAVGDEARDRARMRLVDVLLALGRTEEALRTVEDVVRGNRGRAAGQTRLPEQLSVLAKVRWGRGDFDVAEALMHEALEIERRVHGDASPAVASRYAGIGRMSLAGKRFEDAVGWLETAWALQRPGPEMATVGRDLLQALETGAREADARGDRELRSALQHRAEELKRQIARR